MACAARCNARAPRARRRNHHTQTTRGTARWRARRRLDGGKVLPEISRGATGRGPGKEERAGAHRNGGSTVRRRKRHRAAVFNGGGVAPVVVDMRGGVLQHRCGRGKRDLAPIWEWRSSEGAHRRGGRQRRRSAKSDVRERPPVTGGGGTGAETVG
jgi:hypothetical protein